MIGNSIALIFYSACYFFSWCTFTAVSKMIFSLGAFVAQHWPESCLRAMNGSFLNKHKHFMVGHPLYDLFSYFPKLVNTPSRSSARDGLSVSTRTVASAKLQRISQPAVSLINAKTPTIWLWSSEK